MCVPSKNLPSWARGDTTLTSSFTHIRITRIHSLNLASAGSKMWGGGGELERRRCAIRVGPFPPPCLGQTTPGIPHPLLRLLDPAQGHSHWLWFRPLAPPRGCSVTSGLSKGRPRSPLAPGRCTPPALYKSQACVHRATAALRSPHPLCSFCMQLARGAMQTTVLLGLLGAAALAGEWLSAPRTATGPSPRAPGWRR